MKFRIIAIAIFAIVIGGLYAATGESDGSGTAENQAPAAVDDSAYKNLKIN